MSDDDDLHMRVPPRHQSREGIRVNKRLPSLPAQMAKMFPGLAPPDEFDSPADTTFARHSGYTAAARALHAYLLLYAPKLLEATHLRVLYLGASSYETMDRSRWLHFLPHLLGHQCHLQVAAVGSELERDQWATRTAFAGELRGLPPLLKRTFRGTIASLSRSRSRLFPEALEGAFDLIVMHHPGFVTLGGRWTEDDGLKALLRVRGLQVVGSSFDANDYAWDRLGMATLGRKLTGATWNPAYHRRGYEKVAAARTSWGGVLWRVGPGLSMEATARAQDQLTRATHAIHAMDALAAKLRLSQQDLDFGELGEDGRAIRLSQWAKIDVDSGAITVEDRVVGRISSQRTLKALSKRSLWDRFDFVVQAVCGAWPDYRREHQRLRVTYRSGAERSILGPELHF